MPLRAENARNSGVISAQTTCRPTSCSSVSQHPVRKNPVIGCVEHGSSGSPSRLRCEEDAIGRNLAFPHLVVGLGKDPFQTVRADFPHTAYGRSLWDVMRHYAASGYLTDPTSL